MSARYVRVTRLLRVLLIGVALTHCSDAGTVTPRVAAVELTAPTTSVRLGNTLPLSVRLRDADGGVIDSRAISWSSSAPSVATVSSTGVVSALTAGTARIAASAFGRSATVSITVLPREVARVQLLPAALSLRVGSTATLTARTFDADDELLTGRTVTWTSSAPAVATVNANGVITGVSAGTATITATSEGRSGQAALTVTLAPVASITLAPAVDTVALGGTRTFTATLRDAGGAVLTGRTVSWRTSIDTIATISSTGVVNALSPGTTTVSATSEGRTGTATLVVLARLASSVTLTPATATVVVGTTLALSAQVTDASGNVLTGRPIEFTSANPAVATVSATGVVSGVAPGTTRIVATSEGRVGSATITVVPIPVATVTLTPAAVNVLTEQSLLVTAVARSATGAELTGRAVTWSSGAPGIFTVSAAGRVTGVSAGSALLVATVDGIAGTATVTVRPPTVATVSITPENPALTAGGGSQQLTATARDAAGRVLAGRSVVWASADEGVAFVSSSGLVVGVRPGVVLITATVEGVRGTTQVTVR